MAATTLREPVERDMSDEVFRRIKLPGVPPSYYGNEQLRFLLAGTTVLPPMFIAPPWCRDSDRQSAAKYFSDIFEKYVGGVNDCDVFLWILWTVVSIIRTCAARKLKITVNKSKE
jgi:hypothetical protein